MKSYLPRFINGRRTIAFLLQDTNLYMRGVSLSITILSVFLGKTLTFDDLAPPEAIFDIQLIITPDMAKEKTNCNYSRALDLHLQVR